MSVRPARRLARILISGCARTVRSWTPCESAGVSRRASPFPPCTCRAFRDARETLLRQISTTLLAEAPRQKPDAAQGRTVVPPIRWLSGIRDQRIKIRGWRRSIRSVPCGLSPANARPCLLGSLRRRQHRGSARAGAQQPAQFPARDPVRNRPAARRRSLCRARLPARSRELPEAARRSRRWFMEDSPSLYLYRLRMGDARADRAGRLLLRRRVRARRHQEARAHAPRQGRRSHPPHRRAARADGRGVPHLSRQRGGRRSQPAGDRGCSALRLHGADGVQHTVWRAGADETRRPWSRRSAEDSGALHRRRAPPRGERRAGARGASRAAGQARPRRSLSSPWPFPTTRSRSCPTTVRSRICRQPLVVEVPEACCASDSRSPERRPIPAAQGARSPCTSRGSGTPSI